MPLLPRLPRPTRRQLVVAILTAASLAAAASGAWWGHARLTHTPDRDRFFSDYKRYAWARQTGPEFYIRDSREVATILTQGYISDADAQRLVEIIFAGQMPWKRADGTRDDMAAHRWMAASSALRLSSRYIEQGYPIDPAARARLERTYIDLVEPTTGGLADTAIYAVMDLRLDLTHPEAFTRVRHVADELPTDSVGSIARYCLIRANRWDGPR
jgi:hypothetical protein